MQRFDAGFRHCLDGEYPFRGQGVTVPTLEDMAKAFPDSGWVIDLKGEGTDEALAMVVDRLGLSDRALVGSFSSERLRRFRALTRGRVPTSTGSGETMRALLAARASPFVDPFQVAIAALQVPETWYGIPVVTRAMIEFAHGWGRLVHVWTVNHVEDMARLTALGVDGIITDRPDLLSLR
jgi:glycerophosphoryl diester phosphodiesterase